MDFVFRVKHAISREVFPCLNNQWWSDSCTLVNVRLSKRHCDSRLFHNFKLQKSNFPPEKYVRQICLTVDVIS
ncbi:hypothetical protein L596_002893 [Steinernema carpocapsae]|uniref:Uncharacterized protein n=1 Tax=Steinernema carpocapsae TaxID=34508 RepID=A0A4U8UQT1_STECR|nr:hypothetical protein L596_002893 [Steinernema carpocapsae]